MVGAGMQWVQVGDERKKTVGVSGWWVHAGVGCKWLDGILPRKGLCALCKRRASASQPLLPPPP